MLSTNLMPLTEISMPPWQRAMPVGACLNDTFRMKRPAAVLRAAVLSRAAAFSEPPGLMSELDSPSG